MKNRIASIGVLVALLIAGFGMSANAKTTPKVKATKSITINVKGMTCSACTGKVTAALKKIHGVKRVDASLAKNNVVVETSGPVANKKLIAAIDAEGFQASVPVAKAKVAHPHN